MSFLSFQHEFDNYIINGTRKLNSLIFYQVLDYSRNYIFISRINAFCYLVHHEIDMGSKIH